MEGSESDDEGQLLIDESIDTRKRPKSSKRKQRVNAVKGKKKQPLKIVVKKPAKAKKTEKTQTPPDSKVEVTTRTSTRVRKKTRKHSPPPIVNKPKSTKTKAKVQSKSTEQAASEAPSASESPSAEPPKIILPHSKKGSESPDKDDVDIETVSDDDDDNEIIYSSSLIEETTPTQKRQRKIKRKAGIRLRLSLGKVLTTEVKDTADTLPDQSNTPENKDEKVVKLIPDNDPDPTLEPLRIPKKHLLLKGPDPPVNESSQPEKDLVPTNESDSTKVEPVYYSSTPEDHKPLTIKLSVGKPKLQKALKSPPVSSTKNLTHGSPQAFPNIRRSWGIAPKTPPLPQDNVQAVQPQNERPVSTSVNVPDKNMIGTKETPRNDEQIKPPLTPYFSPGLQSLLDVVSVELHEHELQSSTEKAEDGSKATDKPRSTVMMSSVHHEKSEHDDKGHLPSLPLPKMELQFSSKKRQRSKSLAALSPPCTKEIDNPLVEVKQPSMYDYPEDSYDTMTEKERRRHDKKKVMNSDFVDPDTVMQCDEPERKRMKKKTVLPLSLPAKTHGSSLIMPQMTSNIKSDMTNTVKVGTTCTLPVKPSVQRRPKKGMATAKQRLANKLKLGKTYAF